MKYTISQTDISSERVIMQNITDEQGNIIGQEPTNEYEVDITIGLKHLDNFIPPFSKTIIVKSNNAQTGFEVDTQRQQEIQDYLNLINQ
jgi:hypothetical protein